MPLTNGLLAGSKLSAAASSMRSSHVFWSMTQSQAENSPPVVLLNPAAGAECTGEIRPDTTHANPHP